MDQLRIAVAQINPTAGDIWRNLELHIEAYEEAAENASKLKEQMQSLASNLSSLNGVYGGMLSAMNKN